MIRNLTVAAALVVVLIAWPWACGRALDQMTTPPPHPYVQVPR